MGDAFEKKFTGDKELQEACKTLRKEYKDEFDSKKLDSFKQSEAQILEDMQLLKHICFRYSP